jgi:hypothetical protein
MRLTIGPDECILHNHNGTLTCIRHHKTHQPWYRPITTADISTITHQLNPKA